MTGVKPNDDLRVRLGALDPFLRAFTADGFVFERWAEDDQQQGAGWYEFTPPASEFIDRCYALDLVSRELDGPTWFDSDECQRLMAEPDLLARATPEQVRNLLTVLIRQDRFSDGALNANFESGLLVRILKRASILASEVPA